MLYRGFCTSNEVSVQVVSTVPRRVGSGGVRRRAGGPRAEDAGRGLFSHFFRRHRGRPNYVRRRVHAVQARKMWLKVVSDLKVQRR